MSSGKGKEPDFTPVLFLWREKRFLHAALDRKGSFFYYYVRRYIVTHNSYVKRGF